MKIRTGFVSNSSSSSFTCEICGATESAWDGSPADCGFIDCEHGHIFCDEEKLDISEEDLNKDLIRLLTECSEKDVAYYAKKEKLASWEQRSLDRAKEILKEIDEGITPDVNLCDYDCSATQIVCPICNFIEPSFYDLASYFLATTSITKDEVFAEIKKVNKRRRVLRNHEYVEYCLRKQDTTADKLLMEFKEKFGTYNKFKEYIRSLK